MAIRQQHYFIYEAADIRPEAIAFEILGFEDHFRKTPSPLLYLSPDLAGTSRMLEEVVLYRENSLNIKDMERTSEYYFQVQNTRLISLDPIDSERKWDVFRKIVEGYNLGDVGYCFYLGDFLDQNGSRFMEVIRGGQDSRGKDILSLPGNEKNIARFINNYNREVISRSGGS